MSRVLDGTDKITLTIVGEWILATMTYLVCSVVSRAANDPSVFTITEKAPTMTLSWLTAPTSIFTFKTYIRIFKTHLA